MSTMSPMVGRVSAYFAPVNRTAQQATIFDAAQSGAFALNSPPAPWIGLGWIANFARKCGTKIEPVRTGAPATTQLQARTEIDATVSFGFESWGKLQLALSAGTQQMNLLKVASGATAEGSGGTAIPAVAITDRLDSDRVAGGSCGSCILHCRRIGCSRRRLHHADGLCRQRREWGVCAERTHGCGLHSPRDVERWTHHCDQLRQPAR